MSELQAYLGNQAIPELFNRLYGDTERLSGDIERLQQFVKLTMAEIMPDFEPAAPEASVVVPVEMEASARQRLEQEAAEAAKLMVERFDLFKNQKQTTAIGLACALRAAYEASDRFQCPQTMVAILRALDGMDAAAREAQNNG